MFLYHFKKDFKQFSMNFLCALCFLFEHEIWKRKQKYESMIFVYIKKPLMQVYK